MKEKALLVFLAATLCLGGTAALAQNRRAIVSLSTAYLYAEPDYESALETQALMGTLVDVIGEQGYWRQIIQHDPSYVAWTTDLAIRELTQVQVQGYLNAPKYICTAPLSRVYSRPSNRSYIVSELVLGDLVQIVFSDKDRPVHSAGYCQVTLPTGVSGYVKGSDLAEFSDWARKRSAKSANLEKTARSFLGIPYHWGGVSVKGMDCSGLVWLTYFLNGVILPRNASQQAKCGVEVSLDHLKVGDLIFFGTPGKGDQPDRISHVGMSLGGKTFIHSSQLVRINSLDPRSSDYYSNKQPLFAVRIVERNGTLTNPQYASHSVGMRYDEDDAAQSVYVATPLLESPWYFPDAAFRQ